MTTTENQKLLLPCPHCGSDSAHTIVRASEYWQEEFEDLDVPYPHSEGWAVMCDASTDSGKGGCGASGGYKPNESEAIAAWNRRTPTGATHE